MNLKENEVLRKQMEATDTSHVEKLARIKGEKEKLKGELRDKLRDNDILTNRVASLETRAQVAEECLSQEEFARDAYIRKATKEVVAKFKRSDEFTAFLKVEHDAGYDVGDEEIFFNVWRKRRSVDYRFLGGKLVNLMEGWLKKERQGILNTEPPPSPPYPEVEGERRNCWDHPNWGCKTVVSR